MNEQTVRFRRVSSGLSLILASLALFAFAAATVTVGVATHWREALRLLHARLGTPVGTLGPASSEFSRIAIVANAAVLIAAIMCTVGHQLCLAAPPDMPGRRVLRAAVALQGVGVVHAIWDLLSRIDAAPQMPPPVSWVATVGWLAAWGLLLVFLRCLAQYIRRKDLKAETRTFLWIFRRPDWVVLGLLAAGVCAFAGWKGLVPWTGAAMAFGSLALTAFFVRFAWLLRQVQLGTITYAELLAPRGGV